MTTAAHDARTLLVDEQTHFVSAVAITDESLGAVMAYEYYAPCFEGKDAADLLYLVLPVSQLWRRVLASSNMTVTVAVTSSPSMDVVDLRHARLSRAGRAEWDPARPAWRRGMASKNRLTMYGQMQRIAGNATDLDQLTHCFVQHHEDARMWIPSSEASPHTAIWMRFSPSSVYYVGGFGDEHRIGDVDMAAFRSAVPGPKSPESSQRVWFQS